MSKLIRAALEGVGKYSDKAYFFQGDQYVGYIWNSDRAADQNSRALSEWKLSGRFAPFDAALNGQGKYARKAYFFSGNVFLTYDWDTETIELPVKPLSAWKLPAPFDSGISAALNGHGKYEKKAYFFKGNQYVRYDWDLDDIDQPVAALSAWKLPLPLDAAVDAAVNGAGRFDGRAYFFFGDKYAAYDWQQDQPMPNYPQPIGPKWPGLLEAFAAGPMSGPTFKRLYVATLNGGGPLNLQGGQAIKFRMTNHDVFNNKATIDAGFGAIKEVILKPNMTE